MEELATIYARLIDQFKFKYHILFSPSSYEIDEENQRSDEIELFINLNINHKLTETDIKDNDVKSQLEHQIQIQETNESGWIIDKNDSMKIKVYKTVQMNRSSYFKFPLRFSVLINIKNDDKYCFVWSISAHRYPCSFNRPIRFSNYQQYSDETKIDGVDFSNGMKCSDVQKFEILNNLPINVFELNS